MRNKSCYKATAQSSTTSIDDANLSLQGDTGSFIETNNQFAESSMENRIRASSSKPVDQRNRDSNLRSTQFMP